MGWLVTRMCALDVLAGQFGQPGHLVAQCLVVLVQAPHHVREPAHAALHHHHFELGELDEDALADQADHVGLRALGEAGVPLDVLAHPTRRRRLAGDGAALGAGVDGYGQAVALGGLVDRPVALVAQRRFGGGGEQHLHEVRVVADPVDFLRRRDRVLGARRRATT